MTFDECLKAVEQAAGRLTMVAPDVSAGKGKAFETWILLVVARHLSLAGADISAVGCDDAPVTIFIVRGGPGQMPSAKDDTTKAPCHIVVGRGSAMSEMELHVGLQHMAKSGSSHELDLSALPRWSAAKCREHGGGYYRGPVVVAVEAKAYDAEHKLSQGFARAFLGTMTDLQPWRTVRGVQVEYECGLLPMWPLGKRAPMHLVTSTSLYDNSRRLLDAHDGRSVEMVVPKKHAAKLKGIADDILSAR